MKTYQLLWEQEAGWNQYNGNDPRIDPQLVLFFGGSKTLDSPERFNELKEKYPHAHVIGCSTAGEIIGDEVIDDSVVATAIEFEKTPIRVTYEDIGDMADSKEIGRKLGRNLDVENLRGVFLLSDGQMVNGSELVEGISEVLGDDVIITGGMAGDGGDFQRTLVSCDNSPGTGKIAAVGLYGENIQIGHGSVGGWDSFGPQRIISKSESNVLYELDGKPALELYKKYLGEEASNLPGSALLFPLMIKDDESDPTGTVRTILSIDEDNQSMTFAGDVPEGYVAQLMMANFDRLIDGAAKAAKHASLDNVINANGNKLAILISCVGRKMVLGQKTGDEVEAVMEILGGGTDQIGFYSYGEISPHVEIGKSCELHNQTMTITLLSEKDA